MEYEIQETLVDIINKICVNNYEENMIQIQPNDIFIMELENHLDKSTCDEIILEFEKSKNKYQGETGLGINKKIKNTTDVNIKSIENEKYDDIFFISLNEGIKKYNKILFETFNNTFFSFINITDYGYHIQKYNKNEGFYNWHHDFLINQNYDSRILTFIWYLNDVDEGGETFFLHGKIKPKKGKFVLFPATWTYLHKGNIPISHDKYIVTGWCYSKDYLH
jgi:hypothetical protein